jgi:hypothetical protein
MIVASPVVLPGNRRCQFDQFGLVESLAQTGEQRVWDFDWGPGQGICILQDKAFKFGKVEICAVLV